MKELDKEKLRQIISRTDKSANEKVEILEEFCDSKLQEQFTQSEDLLKRRGQVIVGRNILAEGLMGALPALFSNFYPLHIDIESKFNFHDRVRYFGVSNLFRVLEENEEIPVYEITFERLESGLVRIKQVEEVK